MLCLSPASPHQTPTHTDTHIHTHNPRETSRLCLSQKTSVAGQEMVLPTKPFSTCFWSCLWITRLADPYCELHPMPVLWARTVLAPAAIGAGNISAHPRPPGLLFNQRTAVTSSAPCPSVSRHGSSGVRTVTASQAAGAMASGH